MLAIEKSRINSMGLHEHKKHNNYIKAIISIFAVAVLLSTMGVPIYSGIYAMEQNAIPYEVNVNWNTIQSGNMANIIAYELWHFGAMPSPNNIAGFIRDGLESGGLGFLTEYVSFLVTEVLVYIFSDGLSTLTVTEALQNALIVLGVGAGTGWSALAFVAGLIVAA